MDYDINGDMHSHAERPTPPWGSDEPSAISRSRFCGANDYRRLRHLPKCREKSRGQPTVRAVRSWRLNG
jgi:hypothetical protein